MDYLQVCRCGLPAAQAGSQNKICILSGHGGFDQRNQVGSGAAFPVCFFIAMWCTCRIQKYILVLAGKLEGAARPLFFLLWLILGLFETPAVQGGPIFLKQ